MLSRISGGSPRHDEFVAQVVAICNELAGRVQDGQCQRFRGTARPVSFTTPSGRVDWDPDNEVGLRLAAHHLLHF